MKRVMKIGMWILKKQKYHMNRVMKIGMQILKKQDKIH